MDGRGLEVYRGSAMRGRGLGGVLGSLARFAIPKLIPLAASVGRSLLKAGVRGIDRKLSGAAAGGSRRVHKRKRSTPRASVSGKVSAGKVGKRRRTKKDILS